MANTKKHTKSRFHLYRLGLFSALLVAVFVARFDAAHTIKLSSTGPQVLSYATEMSRSGLLAGTNAARAANNLGPLVLNSQLNTSAQSKAQHMADNDYWSHDAPDGTQPWFFFEQAGYSYTRAGENLAYGFMTSQSTVDGWMASPGHKANILGDYVDVGFGIVNVPSYQGSGEETIVVAHYGSQGGSAPALMQDLPSTQPQQPVSNPSSMPATPTTPDTAEPATVPSEETVPSKPTTTSPSSSQPSTPVTTSSSNGASQTLLALLAANKAPLIALLSIVIVTFSVVGYALTHRVAFHQAVASGEKFVLTHPSTDAAAVIAAIIAILLTSYGHIR